MWKFPDLRYMYHHLHSAVLLNGKAHGLWSVFECRPFISDTTLQTLWCAQMFLLDRRIFNFHPGLFACILYVGILVAEAKSGSIPTERSPVPVLQKPGGPIPDLQYLWGLTLQGLRDLVPDLQIPGADLKAPLHTTRRQKQVLLRRR